MYTESDLTVLPAQSEASTDAQHGLELIYTRAQDDIYNQSKARYVVVTSGRRSGKTYGGATYCIDTMLDGDQRLLWVDIQYNQIIGYFEKYFLPRLRLLPDIWDWRQSQRELVIGSSTLSMRSADRPDLLVGMGYSGCVINEAGIALGENPNLWHQIVRPMMLDYAGSRTFFIGTPRGKIGDDGEEALYYQLYQKGMDPTQTEYQSFQLSSYSNPYLEPSEIKQLEEDIPHWLARQEIFGEFIDQAADSIVKAEWIRYCDDVPVGEMIIQSIDAAQKDGQDNDYSVITTWVRTQSGFYLIDMVRDRVQFPGLVAMTKAAAEKWKPGLILIEDRVSGTPLIQQLKNETRLPVHAFQTGSKDKIERLSSVSNLFFTGRIYFVKGIWNQIVIRELQSFPVGHDDIVDSISQALIYMHQSAGWDKMRPAIHVKHSVIDTPVLAEPHVGQNMAIVQDPMTAAHYKHMTSGRKSLTGYFDQQPISSM